MPLSPLKNLALQNAIRQRPGGGQRYAGDLAHFCRPVFTRQTVAAANRPYKPTAAINQRHRDTVDFRLYPQVGFIAHPAANARGIRQFAHAGMRNRMLDFAAWRRQLVFRRRLLTEAAPPLRQPGREHVVDLVADPAAALLPVGLFPVGNLPTEVAYLLLRALQRPRRAGRHWACRRHP